MLINEVRKVENIVRTHTNFCYQLIDQHNSQTNWITILYWIFFSKILIHNKQNKKTFFLSITFLPWFSVKLSHFQHIYIFFFYYIRRATLRLVSTCMLKGNIFWFKGNSDFFMLDKFQRVIHWKFKWPCPKTSALFLIISAFLFCAFHLVSFQHFSIWL